MAAPATPAGIPQFASLYVGDLHADVTEAMLYEIFNSVGPVASIRVCRDSVTRRSLGYSYVNFHSVSDAERALDTLNYSSIKGRACRIMWSHRDPSLRKSGAGNVYVKNLDRNIDNKALYDTFSLFGNILSCKVATDHNGRSRGYGFVHYETEEAAKQAIERVNNMQIGEKTVHVGPFEKRAERAPTDMQNYTNLYVKFFPAEWDEEKINTIFGECGTVTSAVIMADNKDRKSAFINFENNDGAKKAVDTLHKKDVRSAEEIANGDPEEPVLVDDHPTHLLYVQRAQSKMERQAALKDKFKTTETPSSRQAGVNLYIKNLEDTMDDEKLKELFEPFGTVTSVAVMKDDQQRCKGFGFVCFATPDEATKAVTEMHLKVVKGKPLYVGLAEKKEGRLDRLKQRYQPGAGGAGMGGMPGGKGKGGPMGGMPGKGMSPQQMGGYGGAPQMYFAGGMQGKGMGGMPQMGGMGGMYPGGMGGMMGGMQGKGMPGPMGMGGMQGKGNPMMMQQQQQMMMMQQQKGMMGMMGGMPGKGMQPMPGMMGAQGKGMQQMPGMMGGQGKGMMPQQQAQQPQQPSNPNAPLTAAALAAAAPGMQKQMLGEKLFPSVARFQPELAGKITGMMLEMDNSELLIILESESQMKAKVDEAMRVLETMK